MQKWRREKWIDQFINHRLKPLLGHDGRGSDAATLAKLRRCTGKHPTSALEQVGGLFRNVPCEYFPSACFCDSLDCAAIVATMFATWHQGKADSSANAPRSLGGTLKYLGDHERGKFGLQPDDPVPNIERRFASLLNSHPDDLPKRLRQAVFLLRPNDIPIDWAQLLNDLLYWNAENRDVQRRWARDFWAPRRPQEVVKSESESVTTA